MKTLNEVLVLMKSGNPISTEDYAVYEKHQQIEMAKMVEEGIKKCRIEGNWINVIGLIGNCYQWGYGAKEILDRYYAEIPDGEKYELILHVYTMHRNDNNYLAKYLKDIKKYRPESYLDELCRYADDQEKQVIDANGYVQVYHGSSSAKKQPSKAVSWTVNYEKARWFAYRWPQYQDDAHVYEGRIHVKDIVAYTNDRGEYEVIQVNSVKNIVEFT